MSKIPIIKKDTTSEVMARIVRATGKKYDVPITLEEKNGQTVPTTTSELENCLPHIIEEALKPRK